MILWGSQKMEVPEHWRVYNCEDYFASPLAATGYYDEAGQYQYFWPAGQVYEDTRRHFLVVGSAGVDGIEWGYRKGQRGLWVYYPIEAQFRPVAATFSELADGWLSGRLEI